ncbi:MAG: hypothetical protein RIC55_18850 [Pirellulaceae bacterium]
MKRLIALAAALTVLNGVNAALSVEPEAPQAEWSPTTLETRLCGVWRSTFQERSDASELLTTASWTAKSRDHVEIARRAA